ncbi:uncharacterized protein LOC143431180 [Xylocopa sonorina]|uniref:uncharacterized protein LOC143431180 n=1 Tax=Xylocopa sonorina TaxID=1818115 RepID=UPI00403A8A96
MRFVCSIYILIALFAENKEKCSVQCVGWLEENELVHLSQKLNSLECLKLVQAIYEVTPPRAERKARKHEVLAGNLMSPASKECLVDLEEWNNDSPTDAIANGRGTMEMTLRWLGRPDLAKYVRENRRSIRSVETEDYNIADTLEFPGHIVSRRHTSNRDKHSRTNDKKKTKKKKKKKKRKSLHREEITRIRISVLIELIGFVYSSRKNHHKLKKKENRHPKKTNSIRQRSICCSILFILFFIVVCLVVVYFYKRYRSKARGTRFKHDWSDSKKDKDTFTDCLEWDDAVCSCSDVEGGCTGKCAMCSKIDQRHHMASHRTGSDNSTKQLSGVRKVKKKKERKKQRFNFLQKGFQNKKKEKDQENRDRKKTLEKVIVKKREKDQCACCRCSLNYTDKTLRERKEDEKRALYKWKVKRKKGDKRWKKDEPRKVEKHANVCFNETCK